MAMRDPRNKSRNKAPKRTSSSTRSARSKTTAKYNPRPTSSSTRANQPPSKKVTTGKGGSARLNKALDSVKKTKPTSSATGSKPSTRTVRTNPTSSAPRGAQGPRSAPVQGPYQKPPSAIRSGPSAPVKKPTPKAATPKVSNVGPQIKQAKAVKAANPGRAARAARAVSTGSRVAQLARAASNPYAAAGAIIASDIKNRSVADGTLKGKPNVPTKPGNHKATTTKPTPKKPVDKNPIKAPPKKGSKVLAKRNGKEGVLQNGVFYATGWSPAQRNRYQIQKKKDQK